MDKEKTYSFPERIGKEYIKKLAVQEFGGKINIIKDPKDVSSATNNLSKESVLGFDTETRPSFKKGEKNFVSLLQLSTSNEAYLFRLNYLGLPEELVNLLVDPKILKVGVAILDDIRALQKLRKFDPNGFVELSNIAKNLGIVTCGLRSLAAIFLDVQITKKEQLTNWDRTYFKPSQSIYAATDAWICLKIYRFLETKKLLPDERICKNLDFNGNSKKINLRKQKD